MLYISETGMENISFQKIHQLVKKKGFTDGSGGKESACQCRRHKRYGFHHWVGKIPWRTEWQPTPVFLPGESPWAKEPGRLQFLGSQRVGHDWSNLARTQASMGKKKYITFSQSYNRPNPWGGKTQSMVHPSTESLFAHSKLAGIKCTYLLWKEFLELENILFLVTTLPSSDFCSTINKHVSREILILTTLRVLTIVLKKKKNPWQETKEFCASGSQPPPQSFTLDLILSVDPPARCQRKFSRSSERRQSRKRKVGYSKGKMFYLYSKKILWLRCCDWKELSFEQEI